MPFGQNNILKPAIIQILKKGMLQYFTNQEPN